MVDKFRDKDESDAWGSHPNDYAFNGLLQGCGVVVFLAILYAIYCWVF